LDELRRVRDQTQARIAFLEWPPDTGAPTPPPPPASDDTAGVQERAKSLERIARELKGTLFSITHDGSERIIAGHERRVTEIEALRAKGGSNAEQIDQLIAQSAAVRDAQLSQLRAKEVEAAEKVRVANERVVASLEAERQALAQTERERFVAQALSRLSAEATAQQRQEVEQLAAALFDEQHASEVHHAELRGLSQPLAQSTLEVFSPNCRADLGDHRCRFPIQPPELGRDQAVSAGGFYRFPQGRARARPATRIASLR
jgi:hypothetical protein